MLGHLCEGCGDVARGRICDRCAAAASWDVFAGSGGGARTGRCLTVLMGAPGAGKSTYAASLSGVAVVSTDELRRIDPGDRAEVDRVFQAAFALVVEALKADRHVVLDTTGAHRAIRERALRVARGFRARSRLVFVLAPAEACVERQAGRGAPVPEDVVRQVWAVVDQHRGEAWSEGWDEIEEFVAA